MDQISFGDGQCGERRSCTHWYSDNTDIGVSKLVRYVSIRRSRGRRLQLICDHNRLFFRSIEPFDVEYGRTMADIRSHFHVALSARDYSSIPSVSAGRARFSRHTVRVSCVTFGIAHSPRRGAHLFPRTHRGFFYTGYGCAQVREPTGEHICKRPALSKASKTGRRVDAAVSSPLFGAWIRDHVRREAVGRCSNVVAKSDLRSDGKSSRPALSENADIRYLRRVVVGHVALLRRPFNRRLAESILWSGPGHSA